MTLETQTDDRTHRSGAGTALSEGSWLDDHFEACREAYSEMVRAAGFQPGWRVLDAGCGSGSFLSLLEAEVGATGAVVGTDLDESNIRYASDQRRRASRPSRSDVLTCSVLNLPFEGGSFDGLWCANVTQYFDDQQLPGLLAELQRVVRPGGLVAIKDVDMTAWRCSPGSPFLGAHLAEACLRGEDVTAESQGSLRGRELRRWMERAGFVAVWQRAYPMEFWSPCEPAAERLWSSWLPYLAQLAEERSVAPEDLETWRQVSTPEQALEFVRRPDFYGCEMQVLAVGQVGGPR